MNLGERKKIEVFFKQYKSIKYNKGEIIFHPGELFENISLAKSGYARIYTISKEGLESSIYIFRPMFYFTLLYALTGIENKYYFEALTPIEAIRAPKDDVISFLKKDPDLMLEVIRDICSTFKDLMCSIEYLIAGNAYTKITSALLTLAERVGKKEKDRVVINLNTSHRIIASLTGIARETVSVNMKKLERKGVISYEGKNLIINNLHHLKEESIFTN